MNQGYINTLFIMENYLNDTDPLAIMAAEFKELKEEVKKICVVPAVQQEQKQRDTDDMRNALEEALWNIRIPVQRAALPDGAYQALNDFNRNYRSINRRPLLGLTAAKLFFYGALALAIASAVFGCYCGYHLCYSREAYATRAYHAAVALGLDEPETIYALAQKEWSEDKRRTRAKVRHLEEEVKQLSRTPENLN